jgi:hypothetical protein
VVDRFDFAMPIQRTPRGLVIPGMRKAAAASLARRREIG